MYEARIIDKAIDINEVVREVIEYSYKKGGGALAIFIGYVKGVVDNKNVHELKYTAYQPYATKKLIDIVKEESQDSDIICVKVFHRIGNLLPGEPSVYVFVSAITREKAFEKAKTILERIKHEVPIYKLEKREDGEFWVMGDRTRIKRKE